MGHILIILNFKKLAKLGILYMSLLVPTIAYGAPAPGMGSSALVSPQEGHFWNIHGFKVGIGSTNWVIKENASEGMVYGDSSADTEFLTIKVDNLKSGISIENYSKRWMKDYSNYGFDILGTQKFQNQQDPGLVIDFFHSKSNKQLRQIVFIKDKTAAILTCTSLKENFQKTVSKCNEIIKTFSWLQPQQKAF